MTIPFHKVSGAGNDFIALIEPDAEPTSDWVRQVCQRGISIGADGVFVLRPEGDRRVRMVHYNADGGRAELCLNGTRCAVQLASRQGWGDDVTVATDAGDIEGRTLDDSTVELVWDWPEPAIETLELEIEGRNPIEIAMVDVGVPYAVLDWDGDLNAAPVLELGGTVRNHSQVGRRGANVAFVQTTADHRARMRSFERGVEAETLASGTGVMATAWCKAQVLEPFTVTTVADFELTARFVEGRASLMGDARVVASGEIVSRKS